MAQEQRVSDPVVVFEFLELRSASETESERSERLRWRVQTELRISAARQGRLFTKSILSFFLSFFQFFWVRLVLFRAPWMEF